MPCLAQTSDEDRSLLIEKVDLEWGKKYTVPFYYDDNFCFDLSEMQISEIPSSINEFNSADVTVSNLVSFAVKALTLTNLVKINDFKFHDLYTSCNYSGFELPNHLRNISIMEDYYGKQSVLRKLANKLVASDLAMEWITDEIISIYLQLADQIPSDWKRKLYQELFQMDKFLHGYSTLKPELQADETDLHIKLGSNVSFLYRRLKDGLSIKNAKTLINRLKFAVANSYVDSAPDHFKDVIINDDIIISTYVGTMEKGPFIYLSPIDKSEKLLICDDLDSDLEIIETFFNNEKAYEISYFDYAEAEDGEYRRFKFSVTYNLQTEELDKQTKLAIKGS